MSVLKYKDPVTGEWKPIAGGGGGVGGNIPDALPNPYPLTINGIAYDGSEAVAITVTGGSASENSLLGQTPFTLSEAANVKLVGEGEHTYTVKGKTVADLTTATVTNTLATLTKYDGYYEIVSTGGDNWYNSYVTWSISGLVVGTEYTIVLDARGFSEQSGVQNNGYYIVKNSQGTTIATIDPTNNLATHNFTADTTSIEIEAYPAENYWWSHDTKVARFVDFYINTATDGTERTDVVDQSGTFTDSFILGKLSKGITITADPSCEVYNVTGSEGDTSSVSLPLSGKTVVCFGDSLFGMYTGSTSAPAYVAERTGATVYNVGFGGCRMAAHPYPEYDEFCMYALAKAIADGDWSAQDAVASKGSANFPDQLAILKGIDFAKVDAIVIHYGTNDLTGGVAIGKDGPATYTATLCGALRYSIETLLTAYPHLRIFVSVPAFRFWTADDGTVTYSDSYKNGNGDTLVDFVAAIAEVAKEYNLPVIDSYYGLGINRINATTFLADGVHHNVDGRKRFGNYIGSRMIAEF